MAQWAIKTDIPTSAAHGGTDYKELEIETVTKMEKLSRRLLFDGEYLAFKSFKMMYLNEALRNCFKRPVGIVQVEEIQEIGLYDGIKGTVSLPFLYPCHSHE